MFIGKTEIRLGMHVGGHIGLNVQDRGTVDQIGATDIEHRTQIGINIYREQPHARQTDRIGPEGGPGSEHPETLVTTKARRPYRRVPGTMRVGREIPDQPDVAKSLQATHNVRVAESVGENHPTGSTGSKTRLTRYAELGGERCRYMGDRFHVHAVHATEHRPG